MTGLRVLIGCEESGIVRMAFAARGHDAWSCDIAPAADGSNRHYRCDVREVMHLGWDLAIFHPPCTRLCNSGVQLYLTAMRTLDGMESPVRPRKNAGLVEVRPEDAT